MSSTFTRRAFLKSAGASAAALGLSHSVLGMGAARAATPKFGVSLAGWSLHRTIGEGEGKTPMLEMPKLSRQEFDIEAIELVNRMLASTEKSYLDAFAKNCSDNDVKILLIMVDGEGNIGGRTEEQREDAIARHSKWVDIASDFGCHSIRMNWAGAAHDVVEKPDELKDFIARSTPAFKKLCDYGDSKDINIIIENHGGASSYPDAMETLMAAVDHPRFGTLPDFGNFPRNDQGEYTLDIYDALDRLMVYAKAVSAKCYDFDPETGMETKLDYPRIIENVTEKHGYDGYIGIEYEGGRLSEAEGIKAAKELLDKLRMA